MESEVNRIFDRLGVQMDPDRIARGLSIAEQQLVEIAKALSSDAKVLIMDEPTAALSPVEVDRLFRIAEKLRADGAAVLFISHRLEEVFALCQRVTILRDGKLVRSQRLEGLTTDDLIRGMVGRELRAREHEAHTPAGTVLEVDRLTREGVFADISFEVRAGEVVALAGLVGAGRSEVARAIFGIDRYDAGAVRLCGETLRTGSPTAAMSAGIGFVPEDRRQHGLVMEFSTADNIALASLRRLKRYGLLFASAEREFSLEMGQATPGQVRADLKPSGLALGRQSAEGRPREMALPPAPALDRRRTHTRDRRRDEGRGPPAVVLAGRRRCGRAGDLVRTARGASVADRILAMREGRLVSTLAHDEASEERIIAAATGQTANGRPETNPS